jgi:predicted component of type VI protein secretion system
VFNNLLNHYINCFEKEELVTNFINKQKKKRILQRWLDRFVEENDKEVEE